MRGVQSVGRLSDVLLLSSIFILQMLSYLMESLSMMCLRPVASRHCRMKHRPQQKDTGVRGKTTESAAKQRSPRQKQFKGDRGKTTESGGKRFKGDRLPQWATDLVAAFLVALLASLKPYAELRCENAPNTDELPRTIRF